jgi:DNA (cytosine-5)-methyltransferase 1
LLAELGRVDFLVAGPPCQGHSNLNNKTRRQDPKNELYYRVARFARLFRPRWILIENVQAVLHDARRVVERTRRALRKMGYYVDDGVVRVDDLGVAQTRRRHLLFAVLGTGEGQSQTDLPAFADLLARYRVPRRRVMWAISDLARRSGDGLFDSASIPSSQTQRRIDWLFDNDAYDLKNSQRPECQQGDHRYIGVYGRMRPADPGPTITGGYDTMGRGRYVHPTKRRTITPHEAARIQFFPDWFDFSAVKARARLAQVIGNAVPPKLSYVFALELMR